MLQKEKGVPVAVVEAKENNYTISHGLQQALGYADILDVPCAFSSNGDGFASHNKAAAEGEGTETEFGLDAFPSPAELWARYKRFRGIADDQESSSPNPITMMAATRSPATTRLKPSTA